jgi:hypothetical protein
MRSFLWSNWSQPHLVLQGDVAHTLWYIEQELHERNVPFLDVPQLICALLRHQSITHTGIFATLPWNIGLPIFAPDANPHGFTGCDENRIPVWTKDARHMITLAMYRSRALHLPTLSADVFLSTLFECASSAFTSCLQRAGVTEQNCISRIAQVVPEQSPCWGSLPPSAPVLYSEEQIHAAMDKTRFGGSSDQHFVPYAGCFDTVTRAALAIAWETARRQSIPVISVCHLLTGCLRVQASDSRSLLHRLGADIESLLEFASHMHAENRADLVFIRSIPVTLPTYGILCATVDLGEDSIAPQITNDHLLLSLIQNPWLLVRMSQWNISLRENDVRNSIAQHDNRESALLRARPEPRIHDPAHLAMYAWGHASIGASCLSFLWRTLSLNFRWNCYLPLQRVTKRKRK